MPERSSIFDMIGPVMIGPSSSHTAGVVRIGRAATHILGHIPQRAEITFYNSFARTYEGHGSDRAIIAGLLDFPTDDIRIRDSFQYAQAQGLQYVFKAVGNASTLHPNTIKLNLWHGDESLELIGISKGGGIIGIEEVNGFVANLSATLHTLILLADDIKGTIAFIASILAYEDCNIATMSVSRKGKHDLACHFVEMDSPPRSLTVDYIRSLPWVKKARLLAPIH
ncbi:MAG: L-serine ammonia-lyase, iron-sulfur-dependent subunit beta [Cytophagales bacterium]|nr:L-serine ammonia-lyase, iron-sulfur-dependent subunit beta [Bernardetiaceae bacterium]MDW8203661.1 L-serine ammonia-lyase, iron-sulfur-dependent subunit beta [Cytophagales bacterium]